ncbi:MAG: HDOD domain-containing protein [Sulfuritalea sp.]|nr:HDOD domain-containing protein [Sulfuritalea sp.]
MASFFSRLMGKSEPSVSAAKSGGSEAEGACSKSGQATAKDRRSKNTDSPRVRTEPGTTQSFVCREPILDRDKRIAGYQFSLPEKVEQRLKNDFEFLQKVYDDAVLRNLTSLGSEALLGPRLTFVSLSQNSLDNPRIHELPRDNTVLMLAPVHQTLEAGTIQHQLDALRQSGYAYGWMLRQSQVEQFPQLLQLAACADYVQIDATDFNAMDVRLLLKSIAAERPAALAQLRLIAGELNAVDEFHSYFHAGFDFFLGQFVTRRENWHPPKSNLNRLHIIKLLNLLRSEAEVAEIAERFKQDPVLAFKLLRYINSPVMGLLSPIVSLDKALILLGREKIYRWLSLLLFVFQAPGFEERVLTERALSRAYFLESLAAQGNIPAPADSLFMLGLFSLLDQLMGQTMIELLSQARLPESVHQALLDEPGAYRDALLLAIAAEGQSPQDLEKHAELCGLEVQQVSKCAFRSLAWAHEISSLESS